MVTFGFRLFQAALIHTIHTHTYILIFLKRLKYFIVRIKHCTLTFEHYLKLYVIKPMQVNGTTKRNVILIEIDNVLEYLSDGNTADKIHTIEEEKIKVDYEVKH